MVQNPYQSPTEHGTGEISQKINRQRTWLAWIAFGWLVFLVVHVPSFNVRPSPAGTFLAYKIATTVISTIAVLLFICVPRGWWKAMTIPLAVVLVLVQLAVWNLP